MELYECAGFLEKLTRIPVFVEKDRDALEEYCRKFRFHKLQDYLYPDNLQNLFANIEENQIVSLCDAVQIHFLFTKVEGKVLALGPYCCESLSTMDARILLERCRISKNLAHDLLAYRSHFTVTAEKEAIRTVRILISQFSDAELLPPVRTIDMQKLPELPTEERSERPYAEMVSERYAVEMDMMRAISYGNARQALRDWKMLHERMDYIKKQLGYSLDTSRVSAAITRTVIRVAGMQAGVPPIILDQLTGEISRKNRQAKSIDEIENNTETLIRMLCREIRRERNENAGYLVTSVKYDIETHFAEDITVAAVAKHLDMPESRLIELFRKETGTTPGRYLRTVRMTKAADLLTGTRWTVQKIASEVGIPDANYFVKLFRQEYGVTPTNYREKHNI